LAEVVESAFHPPIQIEIIANRVQSRGHMLAECSQALP
jgi:hypothetical protein